VDRFTNVLPAGIHENMGKPRHTVADFTQGDDARGLGDRQQ